MLRKALFSLLWLGFTLYAFTLAPPAQPDTLDTIIQLSSGQWDGLNPAVVALFNLMGVWPMIYACLALPDGCGQKISAWPFVTVSFAVGAFALLPYLVVRESNPEFTAHKTKLLRLLDSVWLGRFLLLGSAVLLGYGLLQGNWSDFAQQWQTSQFINVMSLDFCLLCAIVSPLVKDDMAKRDMRNPTLFWTAALLPVLGVAFYLSVRSPLRSSEEKQLTAESQTAIAS